MKTKILSIMAITAMFIVSAVSLASPGTPIVEASTAPAMSTTLDLHLNVSFKSAQTDPVPSEPWSYATAYNFDTNSWTPVITHKIGELLAVAGHKNWNLNVDGFAGFDTRTNQAVAGVAGDVHFRVATNADGLLGVGVFMQKGRDATPALLAGFSVRF